MIELGESSHDTGVQRLTGVMSVCRRWLNGWEMARQGASRPELMPRGFYAAVQRLFVRAYDVAQARAVGSADESEEGGAATEYVLISCALPNEYASHERRADWLKLARELLERLQTEPSISVDDIDYELLAQIGMVVDVILQHGRNAEYLDRWDNYQSEARLRRE